jgi:hypothetical protein
MRWDLRWTSRWEPSRPLPACEHRTAAPAGPARHPARPAGPGPATALNTLQSQVSYLRGVLGSRPAILARSPGYVLNAGPEGTDVMAAERLIRQRTQAPPRSRPG